MTILTFAKDDYIRALIAGTKTTTIRSNWERWVGEMAAGHDLHIYKGSWMNPNRVYVGKCKLVSVLVIGGSQFTVEIARADGFDTLEELLNALADHNELHMDVVLNKKWAILEIGKWIHGPVWHPDNPPCELCGKPGKPMMDHHNAKGEEVHEFIFGYFCDDCAEAEGMEHNLPFRDPPATGCRCCGAEVEEGEVLCDGCVMPPPFLVPGGN